MPNSLKQLSDLGWIVLNSPIEILPLNDTRDHYEGVMCWCRPDLDEDGAIVHNADDKREAYTEGRKKPH